VEIVEPPLRGRRRRVPVPEEAEIQVSEVSSTQETLQVTSTSATAAEISDLATVPIADALTSGGSAEAEPGLSNAVGESSNPDSSTQPELNMANDVDKETVQIMVEQEPAPVSFWNELQ